MNAFLAFIVPALALVALLWSITKNGGGPPGVP